MRPLFLLFLTALVIALCGAQVASATAFQFPVAANAKKCFTEELSTNRYSLIFSMRRALARFVSVTVTGEKGLKLWEQRDVDEETRAVLVPPLAGPYTICYHVNKKAKSITFPLLIDMDLELESVQMERARKAYAAEGDDAPHEDPAIPQAEYLDRTIRAVKDAYDYFRTREAALRNTNESSNTRMTVLTVLAIIMVVVVTVLKEYKLQGFLKKKKFLD